MKSRARVLYVDDDKLQRAAYVEGLRDEGFEVTVVETAARALTEIDVGLFDVAVIDLLMPPGAAFSKEESRGGMITGWLLARRARLAMPHALVVILTADSGAREVREWCDHQSPRVLFFRKSDTLFDDFARQVRNQWNATHDPSLGVLLPLLKRFHRLAKRLGRRYNNRPEFLIDDEHDVQDLLHGLLLCLFDDVRPEEWVPSYAAGASRIDFLLHESSIAVEVKKTRRTFSTSKLAEQLIIDIVKYRRHPSCRTLVCFIYDPAGLLQNPRGLVADLESTEETGLSVRVIISPEE